MDKKFTPDQTGEVIDKAAKVSQDAEQRWLYIVRLAVIRSSQTQPLETMIVVIASIIMVLGLAAIITTGFVKVCIERQKARFNSIRSNPNGH